MTKYQFVRLFHRYCIAMRRSAKEVDKIDRDNKSYQGWMENYRDFERCVFERREKFKELVLEADVINDKEILTKRIYYCESFQTIAEDLNLSEAAVKSRYYRVMAKWKNEELK